MNKTYLIDVVDSNGDKLLTIKPHWLPAECDDPEELVRDLLPSLRNLYEYKCYYTIKEFNHDTEAE